MGNNVKCHMVGKTDLNDITLARLKNPDDGYGLAVMQDRDGLSGCVENCKVEDFELMPEDLQKCIADTVWSGCSWFRVAAVS